MSRLVTGAGAGARILFVFGLTGSFLYLMAWPALQRYIEGGVVVQSGSEPPHPALPAPALTICPTRNNTAWRYIQFSPSNEGNMVNSFCAMDSISDIENCVMNKTISFEDVVKVT